MFKTALSCFYTCKRGKAGKLKCNCKVVVRIIFFLHICLEHLCFTVRWYPRLPSKEGAITRNGIDSAFVFARNALFTVTYCARDRSSTRSKLNLCWRAQILRLSLIYALTSLHRLGYLYHSLQMSQEKED